MTLMSHTTGAGRFDVDRGEVSRMIPSRFTRTQEFRLEWDFRSGADRRRGNLKKDSVRICF